MNLKKLFVVEIAVVLLLLYLSQFLLELLPYFQFGANGQIGVFNQREYAQETVTLQQGQRASSRFNYTTYDPAILVVDLKFQDWQKPGYFSMYCNGILIVYI